MTQHQGRHFLNIPGSSPIPDRVLRAMDMPIIDHRSAQFAGFARTVFEGCRIVNTLSPGDKMLMVETGHFAMMWRQMAARRGAAPCSGLRQSGGREHQTQTTCHDGAPEQASRNGDS